MKDILNNALASLFRIFNDNTLIIAAALLAASLVLGLVVFWAIGLLFNRFVRHLHLDIDMQRRDARFLRRFAYLAPAIVFYIALPYLLTSQSPMRAIVAKGLAIYCIAILAIAIDSLFNVVLDIHRTRSHRKWILTSGIVQTLKIADYTLALVFLLAVVLDKSVLYLVSGLGALTAVSMIVFKDAMLGFVAGLQLSANRMIKHGDWIEMPKFGVDGEVIEIDLSTIRVRNWDKTITTVPTYALISDSFKNWRGMEEAGGRRIKRAFNIDATSIKFCSSEMLAAMKCLPYMADYIEHLEQKTADAAAHARALATTNATMFRHYIESYLRHHPDLRQNLTLMVRQLAYGEHGLPIEIYAFCKITEWVRYEEIQADIFDHLLAMVPAFGLRLHQSPTGYDFGRIATYDSPSGKPALLQDLLQSKRQLQHQ